MNMWQEGSVLPISEVQFKNGMVHGTCPILVEGNEYIFRIKAVNKSSKGHWNYSIPSDPSDSMIAKIRYSKLCLSNKELSEYFISLFEIENSVI